MFFKKNIENIKNIERTKILRIINYLLKYLILRMYLFFTHTHTHTHTHIYIYIYTLIYIFNISISILLNNISEIKASEDLFQYNWIVVYVKIRNYFKPHNSKST